MKPGGGSKKGASWEREVSATLSLWWSDGKDDAVFYRTHSSGARATVRSKKGKALKSQVGDIAVTGSRGGWFLRCFTVSLKRGYPKVSLQDLLDTLEKPDGESIIEGCIRECCEHNRQAGSLGWLLIVRRDRRQPLILMPGHMMLSMDRSLVKQLHQLKPHARILARIKQFPSLTPKQRRKMTPKQIRRYKKKVSARRLMSIYSTTLDNFLSTVHRSAVVQMARTNKT
jgi:hypothetical protein